jgi:elongation factor G
MQAVASFQAPAGSIARVRNIGISAHIDSGKTTLTERILFYTGRISKMHEVKGKDEVGATMDSMDLEREKGITIKSAATRCEWTKHQINIIDTPGHVDFTMEVERALRVLDGAILVMCAVSGVQSQTITVDRQMKRYRVPRVVFVNKCDRMGANPLRAVAQLREKLKLPLVVLQLPLGVDSEHRGVIDLRKMKALIFNGSYGESIVEEPIPERELAEAKVAREELLFSIADYDADIADALVTGETDKITPDQIDGALRKGTIARTLVPVLMGSAYKNKGVQPLLDAVISYLPNPTEVENLAIPVTESLQEIQQRLMRMKEDGEEERPKEQMAPLSSNETEPFVGFAFKITHGRFGQLTYMRVYRGTLKRGDVVTNTTTRQQIKTPRLVRMHADQMEDILEVRAGDICAIFGVDCRVGDTFCGDKNELFAMESMFVPEPVMSLAIKPKAKNDPNFGKALLHFTQEDPTFRVETDVESKETIISGMGELHLQIYTEIMRRDYGVETITGQPRVAFRESVGKKGTFETQLKKQTGGSGQYAKVIGFVEPHASSSIGIDSNVFENHTVGGSIPPNFIPACEKGFRDACLKGPLIGHPLKGVRMVVNDGASHVVDSSEMAFRTCTSLATREAVRAAAPVILEPIMKVDVTAPNEFQGALLGNLTRRKGIIVATENINDYVNVTAEIGLSKMFGYSTELRSITQVSPFHRTVAPNQVLRRARASSPWSTSATRRSLAKSRTSSLPPTTSCAPPVARRIELFGHNFTFAVGRSESASAARWPPSVGPPRARRGRACARKRASARRAGFEVSQSDKSTRAATAARRRRE